MTTFTQPSTPFTRGEPQPEAKTSTTTFWIIEDEPNWQDAFRLLLGMACQEPSVYTAHNKATTQAWLEPTPQWPDLILMDWQLADGDDGLALAQEWVGMGFPAERIIIVSGADDIPPHTFTSVSKPAAASHLVPEVLKRIA
jgi:DNA-binding NtrC family response regulator